MFIILSRSKIDLLCLSSKEKLFAHWSVALNLVLNQLIDREVEHVVLDGKVGAHDIDAKSLLVVNDDDLNAELGSDLASQSLL